MEFNIDTWISVDDLWKDLFAINYVYQFRLNENLRAEFAKVGINPFENYKFKANKPFKRFEPNEKQLGKIGASKYFYASNCSLSDLEHLEGKEGLEVIDLSFNNLKSCEELAKNTTLKEGYFEKNFLKSIGFLAASKDLEVLFVRNNVLEEIGALEGHNDLIFIDVSSNSLADISVVKNNDQLKELQCSNNLITNLDFLAGHVSLEVLECDHNQIADFSFAFSLPKLKYLKLTNNPIADRNYNWDELIQKGVEVIL